MKYEAALVVAIKFPTVSCVPVAMSAVPAELETMMELGEKDVEPVPPFANGSVPVTLVVRSIEPANMALVMTEDGRITFPEVTVNPFDEERPFVESPAAMVDVAVVLVALKLPKVGVDVATTSPDELTERSELEATDGR
jgi:hypothetical protein